MIESLLLKLKSFLQSEISDDEWNLWWKENQIVIRPLLSSYHYHIIDKHPSFAHDLLREHRIRFYQDQFRCDKCGSLLFRAMPRETRQEDIVAFASNASFSGREQIIKDCWIHPGLYCPNHGAQETWHIRYDKPLEDAPLSVEEQQAEEEQRRLRQEEKSKNAWAEKLCVNCKKRLSVWADSELGCCGYCRFPLDTAGL